MQYAFQNDDYLFYVFEFAAGGMLFHHLVRIMWLSHDLVMYLLHVYGDNPDIIICLID